MSDSLSFRQELLWNERTIRSVANLTSAAAAEAFVGRIGTPRIETWRTIYPLERQRGVDRPPDREADRNGSARDALMPG